jgi:hypothetical protein
MTSKEKDMYCGIEFWIVLILLASLRDAHKNAHIDDD